MMTLVVLFNLQDGAAAAEYERWAREVDAPAVGSLSSVERFEVLKAAGLLGGGTSPYQYVEIIRIRDPARFGSDVAVEAMQRIAQEFRGFADRPLFIVMNPL